MSFVVGNRDRCGRCGTRHGGNNHLCDVHNHVSSGCCETSCNPADYVWINPADGGPGDLMLLEAATKLGLLENAALETPYRYQDDGTGNYKPGEIVRYNTDHIFTFGGWEKAV